MDPITQQGLAGAAGAGGDPLYVDDVFSTFVYEGNASARSIDNGLDLSGEGGLVWLKARDASYSHFFFDTERGTSSTIGSDAYGAAYTSSRISSFNSNGFSLTNDSYANGTGVDYASWSFRKAPGFFDVVTWTGNSTAGRSIAHSLGSVPGMIWVKRVSNGANWEVWHNSFGVNEYMGLNANTAKYTSGGPWNGTAPTSTHFTISADSDVNANGDTYVAYLFAHNDQSYGTDEDEAIIKCGTYTGTSANNPVNLGFEPQFVLIKNVSRSSTEWLVLDVVRGIPLESGSTSIALYANQSSTESVLSSINPTPTGFTARSSGTYTNYSGDTYLYMAIRRSHKPPETATEVFDVGLRSGSSSDAKTNSSVFTDMSFIFRRDSSSEYNGFASRIQGQLSMPLTGTDAGGSGFVDTVSNKPWAHMTGFVVNGSNGAGNTGNLIDFSFKRAAGFFDAASYEGNAQDRTIAHNLKAVPEMIWVKGYNIAYDWFVYHKDVGNNAYLNLNASYASNNSSSMDVWNSTTPTSSVFSIRANNNVNYSGATFVAYLFASLDGVSKVGRYTGTGNNLDVDCGFSSGARFVMIKRYDGSGQWFVWNSARGIVSGNDPYYQLNLTAAEVTSNDFIDPYNAGFTVTSSAPSDINALGGDFIFFAIA